MRSLPRRSLRHLGVVCVSAVLLPSLVVAEEEPRTETDADRVPRLRTRGSLLIEGATILRPEPLGAGDVLVQDGKISAISRGPLPARLVPDGIARLDGRGRFLTPGAIDCHSHIAIENGINEMSEKISAEVRVEDSIDPTDLSIYRAAAGGTTTARLLHGSANPIGGQDAVIKLRFGARDPKALLFAGAPPGIKLALGENVIRGESYPRSRLAVETALRKAFLEGRAYAKAWRDYESAKAKGEDPPAPRRDLRLEALADVLAGRLRVHCHCYREDEIAMLLDVCEEFGVRVATIQHALEAFKLAPRLARHGCGVSTFSDWWAYKVEAFDAIPGNAGLCRRAGVSTSINSDSGELIRHLFLEAAKSVRYGEVDATEALEMVTTAPAGQLGIRPWVGSIEAGKHADLVVWNGHPLSAFSHPVLTLVDGEVVFERGEPRSARPADLVPFSPTRGAPLGPAPARPKVAGRYAIVDALVLPVSGPPLPRATLVIDKGKIAALAAGATPPEGASVIDGRGLVVSPALWDVGNALGLTEIGSLRETNDASDPGDLAPETVALTAVHPASEHLAVTRAAGVGLSLTAATGGLISGRASLIRLAGLSREELSVAADAALVVNWPSRPPAPGEGQPRPRTWPRKEQLEAFLKEARRDLEVRDAARARKLEPPPPAPKLEALAPYLRREKPVLFRADEARDVADAVAFAEAHGLRPVVLGGRDSWKLARTLAEKRVSVVYGPVLNLPGRDDPWDSCYTAPARLAEAGVELAIRGPAFMSGPRNLPFEAATAASYGLPRERALEAVTLAPARILGLARDRGSLEVGKAADVLVSEGDPLEACSRVRHLFLDGAPVALEGKQSRLYETYRARIDGGR